MLRSVQNYTHYHRESNSVDVHRFWSGGRCLSRQGWMFRARGVPSGVAYGRIHGERAGQLGTGLWASRIRSFSGNGWTCRADGSRRASQPDYNIDQEVT